MERLYGAQAWLPRVAKYTLEIALGITALILIVAIPVTLIGGLVMALLLGWRAIVALVLTVLALVVLAILLAGVMLVMWSISCHIEEKTEDESES